MLGLIFVERALDDVRLSDIAGDVDETALLDLRQLRDLVKRGCECLLKEGHLFADHRKRVPSTAARGAVVRPELWCRAAWLR